MLRFRLWVPAVALGGLIGLTAVSVGQPQPAVGGKVKVGGPIKIGVAAQPAVPPAMIIGPDGRPTLGPAPKGGSTAAALSAIKIVEKSEFRQIINAARACIKDQVWEEAVTALQTILDQKEDHYVQVRDKDPQGKETLRWTSVKFEANNLLGSMPGDGLEVYEQRVGNKARDLLDQAKKNGDRELLGEVAQRYCHTTAGVEANELLGTLFLARGQNFMAALRFEKLLATNPDRIKLSELTLYKAALAFRRTGDTKNADVAWKRLESAVTAAGGLKLGDQTVPVAKLQEVLNEDAKVVATSPHDWPMIRGNLTNTAQASGSPPLLDSMLWRRPVLLDKDEHRGDVDKEQQAKARIDQALEHMKQHNQAVLPGFFPIASRGLLIYRSHAGIRAVAIKEYKDTRGKVYKPGDIVWKSLEFRGGLVNLLDQNATTKATLDTWLPNYFNIIGVPGVLYENSTVGTLSTDHQFIYAVDDLAVPPPFGFNPHMLNQPQVGGEMRPLITQNALMAFNLNTNGKLEWELGGKDDPIFADSHFLGVPVSVGGKLYVLNEKNPPGNTPTGDAELRLVCIDPTKKTPQGRPIVVEPIQLLGMVQAQNRVSFDISRRANAVHLAFGEGVLVCPTNAGEVFGVDLMTRSLVWSYPYREQPHSSPFAGAGGAGFAGGGFGGIRPVPFPGNPQPALGATSLSNWKSTPPAIQDGKVVFTAPDASSIHCVNLRDGTAVWTRGQIDGDLFMGGAFNGRVLVVGKSSVRALNLHNGQMLWSVSTGDVPSGQGVASKGIYYLPLSKGEILAIDIEKGAIKAHNRAANTSVSPGNLVFYEGAVLSQTPTDIIAYPQLVARLDLARKALEAEPTSLERRTDHGELLLKDGQVQAAVDELVKVADQKPAAELRQRVSDRLYEALTDLLQVDFDRASEKYLDRYAGLVKEGPNAQEQQLRQARFYRIVGQGRETQGNLVEAFQMYKDFGALPVHRQMGGVVALDDPGHKVPTDVWLRGRVSAMMAKATPEQKAPLEKKILEEWRGVEAKQDVDAIRSFVGMFDVPFIVGREARLKLAETIVERNDRNSFLEAELNLQQLRGGAFKDDPATGGRALAALAHLEEKKGTADSMKLAAAYYRALGRDFAAAKVRGDKTGADLFNELASDKRFLPYLEEAGSPWGQVKIAARKLPAGGYGRGMHFVLQPAGDDTPFARQHRLLIDPNNPINPQVRLLDVGSDRERWAQSLGTVPANNQIFYHLYQNANVNNAYRPNARFRFFHVKGHLIVCQVGVMAYCLDGDSGKVLWRHSMAEGLENQPNLILQQATVDAEGNPEFVVLNQFGRPQTRLTLGQIGAVQASYVALLTSKGLVVNDPLRGNTLWKKPDVAQGARVFGDEQHIYVIEGNEGGALGAGRVLRATDGEVLEKVPDFGLVYQHRLRVAGGRILAAMPGREGVTLKLYDILSGKDVWAKQAPADSAVLKSEDEHFTGVVDAKGQVVILDAATGAEVLSVSAIQGRVSLSDVVGQKDAATVPLLKEPLLLADADHFYLALNHALDSQKVAGGLLHNNFSNGLRCDVVNGWVLAFHRKDGRRGNGDGAAAWKKGDLAWHSHTPVQHQLVLLEQFDQLPVLLFSARYNEMINGGAGGNRWLSGTQSIHKRTGKWVFHPGPEANNSSPQYFAFNVDPKAGAINMVGYTGVVQHYVDDGRPPPQLNMPVGTKTTGLTNPYGRPVNPFVMPAPGVGPGIAAPAIIRRIAPAIKVAPAVKAEEKK